MIWPLFVLNEPTIRLIHVSRFCVTPYASFFTIGLLEISPVERGVVSLFGVKSGLFVAMNSKGKLYGSVSSR